LHESVTVESTKSACPNTNERSAGQVAGREMEAAGTRPSCMLRVYLAGRQDQALSVPRGRNRPGCFIDIDYVIRRADLRRQGVYGAATLVVALRQAGFDADLVKRTARQTVFSSLTHRVQYVKEQEQLAIRIGPERILFSLKLDRDWQKILEQFHQYVSDSCFNMVGLDLSSKVIALYALCVGDRSID